MRLFVVATSYQLFNAINITEQDQKFNSTELVFIQSNNKFSQSIDIKYLRNIFSNVYIVNYHNYEKRIHKFIYTIYSLLRKDCFGTYFKKSYDEVFISGTEIISKIVATKVISKYTKLYYYEDGLASYESVLKKQTKKLNDLPIRIICGYDPFSKCEGLYVYEPELVRVNSYLKRVIAIKKINKSTNYTVLYKRMYKNLKITDLYNRRIIFFNAWFESIPQYALQSQLVQLISEIFMKDQYVIKTHPNENVSTINCIESEFIFTRESFEVANYYKYFGNSILISIISTACFTPKLIYNEEPIIILLFKLYQQKFGMWLEYDEVISNIAKCYKDQSKIYMPATIEEYERILCKLNKEQYNENEKTIHKNFN